jgi:hypothetical protein
MDHNERTGEQIQHETYKGIIAGLETAAVVGNVIKEAWDNRVRPVKVYTRQPGAKDD